MSCGTPLQEEHLSLTLPPKKSKYACFSYHWQSNKIISLLLGLPHCFLKFQNQICQSWLNLSLIFRHWLTNWWEQSMLRWAWSTVQGEKVDYVSLLSWVPVREKVHHPSTFSLVTLWCSPLSHLQSRDWGVFTYLNVGLLSPFSDTKNFLPKISFLSHF